MIEETGRVIAVKGNDVWVETIRASSCSGCSVRSGCGQGLLARVKDGSRSHIQLHTELKLAVDDEIILGLPEQAFIKSSFLAYGLPMLTLIATVLLADKVFFLSEPWIILSAVLGLAAGFSVVRLVSQMGATQDDFKPVIIRTIPALTVG